LWWIILNCFYIKQRKNFFLDHLVGTTQKCHVILQCIQINNSVTKERYHETLWFNTGRSTKTYSLALDYHYQLFLLITKFTINYQAFGCWALNTFARIKIIEIKIHEYVYAQKLNIKELLPTKYCELVIWILFKKYYI